MTTTYDLPPRAKSQRVINKTEKYIQYEQGQNPPENEEPQQNLQQDIYPGLNDISDAFELFPQELIRYFTLLKEIDAKCVYTVPYLKLYIILFLKMDFNHPKRQLLLFKIRNLIKELMPSLEEKMHVLSILVDIVNKNLSRIQDDYDEILNNDEIPMSIRIGPLNHPAMIIESKLDSNSSKSIQSQRSESRRELLLLKKLLNINAPTSQLDDDIKTKKSIELKQNTRKRKNFDDEPASRSLTPLTTIILSNNNVLPSVQLIKSKKPNNGPIIANTKTKNFSTQEPVYCYCQQVSFGEMVGCDGDDCKREWFHLPCIGLNDPPKGKWYCNDCLLKLKKKK